MNDTYNKTITKNQKFQLIGLLTIARDAAKTINDCEAAMAAIVEYKSDISSPYCGLLSDATFDDTSIEQILKFMGIKVIK